MFLDAKRRGQADLAAEFKVRPAVPTDAAAIALIYNQGIEDRIATFETELRDADERRRWLEEHDEMHPVIVAESPEGQVVGWGSISAISPRRCYSGVGEYSVYVRRDVRGRGLGSGLLESLIGRAAAQGYWKLIGRMFSFNEGSRHLSRQLGFREVGVLEKHGKLDRRWVDVVEVERLIPENID
jgi:L-amino acid N-acyltransferase YncA